MPAQVPRKPRSSKKSVKRLSPEEARRKTRGLQVSSLLFYGNRKFPDKRRVSAIPTNKAELEGAVNKLAQERERLANERQHLREVEKRLKQREEKSKSKQDAGEDLAKNKYLIDTYGDEMMANVNTLFKAMRLSPDVKLKPTLSNRNLANRQFKIPKGLAEKVGNLKRRLEADSNVPKEAVEASREFHDNLKRVKASNVGGALPSLVHNRDFMMNLMTHPDLADGESMVRQSAEERADAERRISRAKERLREKREKRTAKAREVRAAHRKYQEKLGSLESGERFSPNHAKDLYPVTKGHVVKTLKSS